MKKPRRVFASLRPSLKIRTDYLALCAFFLIGVFAGHLAARLVTATQNQELTDYLSGYTLQASASIPLGGVLFSYFRGAAVFFLLGLFACGVWLIPLCTAAQGFSLAFAVQCFAAALGRSGILFSFAAFGIRCLFILPCCFFLAARSWSLSAGLRRTGRKGARVRPEKPSLYPAVICTIILLIGCVIEISLVPRLFAMILR